MKMIKVDKKSLRIKELKEKIKSLEASMKVAYNDSVRDKIQLEIYKVERELTKENRMNE